MKGNKTMNERLNEIIEDALTDNYRDVMAKAAEKIDKTVEPSAETCKRMFFRTNSGDPGDILGAWEALNTNARMRAAKVVFGL